MFEDALRYPWRGEKNLETIAIGGILSLLGFLFVPVLFVYGYLVRVVRESSAGQTEVPPEFDHWETLLVDGVVAFLISLVYTVVPALLVAGTAALWIVPFSVTTEVVEPGAPPAPGGGPNVVVLALAVLTVVLALILLLAALYLFPAAIGAYARTGSLGAAFSPSTLRRLGGRRQYLVGLLVAIVVNVGAQLVAGVAAVTVIGLVVVPFLTFYGNVAGAYAIGRGIRDVTLPGATDARQRPTGVQSE